MADFKEGEKEDNILAISQEKLDDLFEDIGVAILQQGSF